MQHVVLHWQGSVDAAANSEAMQLGPEAFPYGGPPDPSNVGQVDHPGDQVDPQGADANSLSSVDAKARELPDAGRHCAGKPIVCCLSKQRCALQQAMFYQLGSCALSSRQAVICLSAGSTEFKQCQHTWPGKYTAMQIFYGLWR